jgi:proline racemase
VAVFADGQIDPSPSETGTAALTAVLSTMGLLGVGDELIHEGLSGATLRGRVAKHTAVEGYEAVLPEVEGTAWIVGDQELIADDRDSLAEGFRI